MEFLQGWGMWTNPRKAVKNMTGGTFGFFWGARNCTFFCVTFFFFLTRLRLVSSWAQPGGAGNGNPPAAARAPSLPLPRAPGRLLTRPLLLPFRGGGGAGGQARGARTKGGGTNTHLRPEQKTAAPGATPILPGHPALPAPAAPLSGTGCLGSAGGPLLQSHFRTIVGVTTFLPLHT